MERREQSTERLRRTYRGERSETQHEADITDHESPMLRPEAEPRWAEPSNSVPLIERSSVSTERTFLDGHPLSDNDSTLDEGETPSGTETLSGTRDSTPETEADQSWMVKICLWIVIVISVLGFFLAFFALDILMSRLMAASYRDSHKKTAISLDDRFETVIQNITYNFMTTEASTTESIKSKVTEFPPVPGFYIMPALETKQDWMQPQQSSSISAQPTSDAKTRDDTRSLYLPSNGESSTFDTSHETKTARLDEFGGEERSMIHEMHRRGLHMYTHWCIDNVCSTGKRLAAMCNDTAMRIKNITINRDKARRQECAWCWDPSSAKGKRNATQKAQIRTHCEKVSNRAAVWVIWLCGLLAILVLMAVFGCLQRAHGRRRIE